MNNESAVVGLLCGAANGFSAIVSSHPFDCIKTRMQAERTVGAVSTSPGGKPLGAWGVGRAIFRESGIRGLYRGALPPLLGTSVLRSVQFGSYAWGMDLSKQLPPGPKLFGAHWATWISGGFAGFARTFFEVPLELIKVRQQVGMKWDFKSLYNGFTPTMTRNIVLCGLFYGFADACKPFRHHMPPLVNGLFLGSIVATGVWVIIYPFDTLKSQVQTSTVKIDMWKCAANIWREDGVRGFFRGITPGLLRSAVGNGAGMMAFEAVRVFCAGRF